MTAITTTDDRQFTAALSALNEARITLLEGTLSLATAAMAVDGAHHREARELGYRLDALISDVARLTTTVEDDASEG